MDTNQRGFASIFLILIIVLLAGALVYVTLLKQPISTEQSQLDNPQNTPKTIPPTSGNIDQELQTPSTPLSKLLWSVTPQVVTLTQGSLSARASQQIVEYIEDLLMKQGKLSKVDEVVHSRI